MTKRPIKFRAWDNKGKEMFDVIMISWPKGKAPIISGRGGSMTLDDGDVLLQFTGLTDKNGKEIWEGDILRCRLSKGSFDHIATIELGWSENDEYGFYWRTDGEVSAIVRKQDLVDERYEVIGNIYENPNLIKP